MPMMLRSALALGLAVLSATGCTDSTEPVETVPRQLYYITYGSGSYPYTSGGLKLFGLALDGSGPVQVIPDSTLAGISLDPYFPPWISPDGQQIMVLGNTDSIGDAFMTLDPFGAVLSLTRYPDSVRYGAALSPDGDQLAWFANGFLNVAEVDGSGITKIYFDSLGPVLSGAAWSRDGGSVAYVSYFFSQTTGAPQDIRVWTRRFSDGFARPVATISSIPDGLAWSRDARWLTFITSDGEIHRVRTDGAGSEQVVYGGGTAPARSSSWGPRDSLLAIATGETILVLRPDGTGARTVATGIWLQSAAWRD
jgi:hypothetical protein